MRAAVKYTEIRLTSWQINSNWMPSSLSPCRRSADAEVAAADEVV